MIFDVARHKFAEGFITLLLFVLLATTIAAVAPWHSAELTPQVIGGAPLGVLIDNFAAEHRWVAVLLTPILYVTAVLRLARPTARLGLYSATTLAVIALAAIALFGVVLYAGYFHMLCVALLYAEMLGRLLYCFGPNMRAHRLFTSMLALGTLPLVDISFIPLALLIPIVIIVTRGTLRETTIAIVGVLLPIFAYCYITWCLGGNFGTAATEIYRALHLYARAELAEYLDLPRLVLLGALLFLQFATLAYYPSERVTLSGSARTVWRLLMLIVLALLLTLLLLPAASPAIIVALAATTAVMMPLLFIRTDAMLSALVYIATAVISLIAAL